MTAAGPSPAPASARTALRNWPIALAARRPRPTTSPTTIPTLPPGSSKASCQSPPTSRYSIGGLVERRDREARIDGRRAGEQAPLQRVGDVARLLVEASALHGERGLAGDGDQERALVGRERARRREVQAQQAVAGIGRGLEREPRRPGVVVELRSRLERVLDRHAPGVERGHQLAGNRLGDRLDVRRGGAARR